MIQESKRIMMKHKEKEREKNMCANILQNLNGQLTIQSSWIFVQINVSIRICICLSK